MMKSEGQKAAVVDINPIAVLVIVLVRPDQYDDQYTNFKGTKRKVPDFARNQELSGGDYWTRTSDLLRVKQAL